jgi:aminoglycoside phosphotransferase
MTAGVVARFHGHSRCEVLLCRGPGGYFVRKISGAADYDDRLTAQMEKQAFFRSVGFPCPAVLARGERDGRPYFDMEYVAGRNAVTMLEASSPARLDSFAETLLAQLSRLAATVDGALAPDLFTDKIAAVRATPFSFDAPAALTAELTAARLRFADLLAGLDWSGVPASQAHGDMTLENIIQLADGSLTFIDFLDGDLSSFWLDIAKLHQDLRAHWFLRGLIGREGGGGVSADMLLSLRHLADRLDAGLAARWPAAAARAPQLLAFQLFRIFPYCVEPGVARFVADRIAALAPAVFADGPVKPPPLQQGAVSR